MDKDNKQIAKNISIVTAALILPGGFVALGVWKVIELLKKKKKEAKK